MQRVTVELPAVCSIYPSTRYGKGTAAVPKEQVTGVLGSTGRAWSVCRGLYPEAPPQMGVSVKRWLVWRRA